MSSSNLVSVVLITYNSEAYVVETLESIAAQTYRNIELIISDDCSSDQTVAVCKLWLQNNQSRFANVELLTTEVNSGIPGNCNRGIKKAKGMWIKLIAGDDILLPNAIADNVDFVQGKEIKILFSKIQLFKVADGKRINLSVKPSNHHLLFSKGLTAKKLYHTLLHADVISFTPSVFFKSSVFTEIGFFDERYRLMEDYPFWLKATKNGVMLHIMDKLTVLYRIHDQSVFGGAKNEKIVSKAYLRNENFRKDQVYPNYSTLGLLNARYIYGVNNLLKNLNANSFNRKIHLLLVRYTNPFYWINAVGEKVFGIKNMKLKRGV
jgi:alpha-1,3-rhamnosyltransferase